MIYHTSKKTHSWYGEAIGLARFHETGAVLRHFIGARD